MLLNQLKGSQRIVHPNRSIQRTLRIKTGNEMQNKKTCAGINIIAGNLPNSENSQSFLDGSTRSAVQLRSTTIGLGTYQPGWKWSLHVGQQTGKPSENHIGYIISGYMMIRDSTGFEQEIGPGDAFEATSGHDAWVVGSTPCTALDFTQTS